MALTKVSGSLGTVIDGRTSKGKLNKNLNSQYTDLLNFLKQVKDCFISSFIDEYGSGVDYNSIVSAITFNNVNTNGVIMPSFSFDESKLIFLDDAIGNENFNLSSYEDFISNDGLIAGENILNIDMDDSSAMDDAYSEIDSGESISESGSVDSESQLDDYETDIENFYTEFIPTRVNSVMRDFENARMNEKKNKRDFVISEAIKKARLILIRR